MVAFAHGLVGEVHLCRSDRIAGAGVRDMVTPYLRERGWVLAASPVRLGDTRVECWRHGA
jgi:hypothetical protein